MPAEKPEEEEPPWKTALKYFLHGILFSILLLVLGIFWLVIFAVLVAFGFIIGFIIGFFVLFLIVGGLNSFLTDMIWSIPVKTRWISLLGHGLLLFIVLIIVSIPQLIINIVAPNLAVQIVLFVVYAFVDGFVAKRIGGIWEEEGQETDS